MTRPVPWRPRPVRAVWLDYPTGRGVDDDGRPVKPVLSGRRRKPRLVDLLETARRHDAGKIMLTGKIPPAIPGRTHWLIDATPGWDPNPTSGHWLEDPPTGRFIHAASKHSLEVRLAAEWFGGDGTSYGPNDARDAWQVVETIMTKYGRGARMFLSPAATGMHAWALALPKDYHDEPLPDDIADLIHRTAGQHRIEHMTPGRSRCDCGDCLPLLDTPKIPQFTYIDGRFMYSALLRELGTGPAYRLTASQAAELAATDRYARARYHVRAVVPNGWDTLGTLGAQLPGEHWHYPNRPGAHIDTWCDAVELDTARILGWRVEVLEGIQLTQARPADAFRERLVKAREGIENLDIPDHVASMARAALRMILLQTVGVWHSRGRARTIVAWSPHELPQHAITTVREYDTADGATAYVYRVPSKTNPQAQAYHRPELSAQVWARARTRILIGPSAIGPLTSGAIDIPPEQLIGINGDAIYTAGPPPAWALPTSNDGADGYGDDGKEGRLRLRGSLPGPLATPTNESERNKLRARAEAHSKAKENA